MNIQYYILFSFVLLFMYKWIKRQRWIQQNSPGDDIPNRTHLKINSPKPHLQLDNSSNQIYTINKFLESYRLLDLNIFSKEELSEQMINEAYTKRLNEHVNSVQKGIESEFDISALKSAREYLIQSLNNPRKSINGTIN